MVHPPFPVSIHFNNNSCAADNVDCSAEFEVSSFYQYLIMLYQTLLQSCSKYFLNPSASELSMLECSNIKSFIHPSTFTHTHAEHVHARFVVKQTWLLSSFACSDHLRWPHVQCMGEPFQSFIVLSCFRFPRHLGIVGGDERPLSITLNAFLRSSI